jgi:hypothetical protein
LNIQNKINKYINAALSQDHGAPTLTGLHPSKTQARSLEGDRSAAKVEKALRVLVNIQERLGIEVRSRLTFCFTSPQQIAC